MFLPTHKIGSTPVTAVGWGAMSLIAAYSDNSLTEEERLEVSSILDHITHPVLMVFIQRERMHSRRLQTFIGKWQVTALKLHFFLLCSTNPLGLIKTGKRDDRFLATKCGLLHDFARPVKAAKAEPH